MADDKKFMRRALALAKRGRGLTSPNPMVGAVLVRDGRIIGEGWHRRFGGPHAEIEALEQARDARGAMLFVTLEPCCHQGKTPPCTDRIAGSGIRRVITAMPDPNPLVSGRGHARLREAGITVESGLLAGESAELNRAFITFITRQRPHVTLKTAQTIDGKIAAASGCSKWLTAETTRRRARRLRFDFDAILAGIGTVLADDPGLGFEPPAAAAARAGAKKYRKVILDSRGRLPLSAKLWADGSSVIVATSDLAPARRLAALEKRGALIAVTGRRQCDPEKVLEFLYRQGIASLLVEGGGRAAWAFAAAGAIDRVYLFQAPLILGGARAPTSVEGAGFPGPESALRFKLKRVRRFPPDLLLEYEAAENGP